MVIVFVLRIRPVNAPLLYGAKLDAGSGTSSHPDVIERQFRLSVLSDNLFQKGLSSEAE